MKIIRKILASFLFVFLLSNISIAQQADNPISIQIDSLFQLTDDTNKVNAINDFWWKNRRKIDSANYFQIAEKNIKTAEKLNFLKGLGTAQKILATYYYYEANYDKALELYQKSFKNYDSCNYKKGIAIDYRNIGNVYSQLGATKEAIKNYFKSLKLRDEINDTVGMANIYIAIGSIYINTEDYKDSAIVYFNRALETFKKTNSIFSIASTYLRISNFYYDKLLNKNDTISFNLVIKYANKSLELSKEYNIQRLMGTAYEIKGESFRKINMQDSAYLYLKKSLTVRQDANNVFGIVNSLSKLGNYFLSSNNYSQAKKYLKQALELSQMIGSDQVTKDIYGDFSLLYKNTGDYKKAFEYFNRYINLKDSLQNKQNTKQLTQLAMQYEFDKKQKIQELEQEKKDAETEAEIKQQKLMSYFFLAGLVFMLIVAFVIFRSYKQKQKTNKLLKDKNDEINIKNAQLNQRNEEIEAQKDEIEAQKDEIEDKKNQVEKQNSEITASINYAQRIQGAVLTPIAFFKENFDEFFILFKPRDIVSGDYYWASKLENKIIITAADCTGHGVPGAFMSMLGVSFLNQITNYEYDYNKENFNAANILNKLRDLIVLSLGHGAAE
ncbi:MAG: tetratricopeptide repeat protein, partial [Bacteroidota bacterium]|nr:tetratricopeptide repeat protein [Bacteroidota bacterium]